MLKIDTVGQGNLERKISLHPSLIAKDFTKIILDPKYINFILPVASLKEITIIKNLI